MCCSLVRGLIALTSKSPPHGGVGAGDAMVEERALCPAGIACRKSTLRVAKVLGPEREARQTSLPYGVAVSPGPSWAGSLITLTGDGIP